VTGFGDAITLLAGHTAVDILDTTIQNAFNFGFSASQLKNAMSIVTNFNLGTGTIPSGDILKLGVTGGTLTAGSATDITGTNGHIYTNVGAGTGFVTGPNVSTFLTDVAADTTYIGDHVIAYLDTVGKNTYVVAFDKAGALTAGHEQIVELIGVSTATALSLSGSALGTIHMS
jgi:hypothetical protein